MCRKPKTKAFKKLRNAKKVGASKTRNAGKGKKRIDVDKRATHLLKVEFSLKVQGMPKMKAL